eukprot:jgi/Tetstr1/460237/TSEL_000473.t1
MCECAPLAGCRGSGHHVFHGAQAAARAATCEFCSPLLPPLRPPVWLSRRRPTGVRPLQRQDAPSAASAGHDAALAATARRSCAAARQALAIADLARYGVRRRCGAPCPLSPPIRLTPTRSNSLGEEPPDLPAGAAVVGWPMRMRFGGIAVRREVDDLFQQAVPLGDTASRDELKDLVPDAELSLPAFNVVTGSYDPRSLKSTLLEFKTMWYGVKHIAVPRATAVDRFERSMLGDIQRGLAARDAAWHNTEPGQEGSLRDIPDMSEYTGIVFGTMGQVSKGVRRTVRGIACLAADRDSSAIPLLKLHSTSEDHPQTHVHAWPGL